MAKRIDTSNIAAGQELPINANRLDYLQDNANETVSRLINGLIAYTNNDIITLYGCVITGSDPGARTMTAGAIFYNGLVYAVDAASFTTTGSLIPVWKIATTHDDSGAGATFSNGAIFEVEYITKFVLVSGPVGGSGITGYVADYNSSTVKTLQVSMAGKSTSLPLNNSYTSPGGLIYRKDAMGNVYLQGNIQSPGSVTSNQLGTLPVGFRPPSGQPSPVFPVGAFTNSEQLNVVCRIGGTGEVELYDGFGAMVAAGRTYLLSSIRFNINP